MLNPNTIYIGIALIILAIATHIIRKYMESEKLGETLKANKPEASDCGSCDGSNSKCEQECMMEAATKDIEYFDDEELDRFARKPSSEYTDDEAEEFREVLYSMRAEEVKAWNRSLILREINVPDQLKDELLMMLETPMTPNPQPPPPLKGAKAQLTPPSGGWGAGNMRLLIILLLGASFFAACSTKKNTGMTRRWHSFTAKYNTYYNGSLAYIDGALEKENGNKDNFTEIIPLYTVGNKASRDLGKGNFDRAIEKSQKAIKRHSIKKRPEWNKNRPKTEKDLEWLTRKEYNPFLWKAWLMMGKSQFMKGEFDEAASTFAYMARMYSGQPAIYAKARAWLARCYTEHDWLYDAEDVIKKMQRDSIHWKAQKDWNYALADYYIRAQRFTDAIPYLQKVIKRESRRKQKAREYYLLGQIYKSLDRKEEAYKAFRSCVRCNPPYELAFNARISMTEVTTRKNAKSMIGTLKRMARNDNNKDYLDQVYYAIGNIYLTQKDTANAISAYEKGNEKATRSGIEKGVLLLKLGDIYWVMERYSDAKRCYGEAIGLLDKERKDYELLSKRSQMLDELVPHTDAIHLNDSLLELSVMPEKERNEAIDRVIEALKKKEKEEKDRLAEEEVAKAQANTPNTSKQQTQQNQQNTANNQQSTFYFYNPMAVNQGKEQFRKIWGTRENADDWQRSNKTVVSNGLDASGDSIAALEDLTDEQRDSIMLAEAKQDSIDSEMEKPENDPHKREYYMKQIPFEPEQKAECHKLISDGLFNSGVIFKDKFDNLPLSEKQLTRLQNEYPNYEKNADIYYHCYLLYNRMHRPDVADRYLTLLKDSFPEHEWTKILSDPYFAENAIHGTHLEDSLYAETYEAFKTNNFTTIYRNYDISDSRFPLGDNRDRFIFIHGLSKLNEGDAETCLADMQNVVDKYPKSQVQPLAGMIINGVKAGRKLHGGRFDMGDVWSRRTLALSDSDSIAARKFVADLNVPYTFLFAYNPDSLETTVVDGVAGNIENKLLFELARFNFTTFIVRNFNIEIEEIDGLHRMRVSGFQSYQEARQYARQLYEQSTIIPTLAANARPIIISDTNLELLGTQYSYNDYEAFYEVNYVPLKLSTIQLLTEPILDSNANDDETSVPDNFVDGSEEGVLLEESPTTGQEDSFEIDPTTVPDNTEAAETNEAFEVLESSGSSGSSETLEVLEDSGLSTQDSEDDEIIVSFDDETDVPTNSVGGSEDDILLEDPATGQDEKKDATDLENDFFEIEDF